MVCACFHWLRTRSFHPIAKAVIAADGMCATALSRCCSQLLETDDEPAWVNSFIQDEAESIRKDSYNIHLRHVAAIQERLQLARSIKFLAQQPVAPAGLHGQHAQATTSTAACKASSSIDVDNDLLLDADSNLPFDGSAAAATALLADRIRHEAQGGTSKASTRQNHTNHQGVHDAEEPFAAAKRAKVCASCCGCSGA